MPLQLTKKGEIDWGTVARLGLGGAAIGGGLAGIISLIHSINLARARAAARVLRAWAGFLPLDVSEPLDGLTK